MSEYIVKSSFGSAIPPWSAMEITAVSAENGRTIYSVTRPRTNNLPAGKILFSGACGVPANGYGLGYSAFDKVIFSNGTSGDDGYCGVAADSFDLNGTNTGFVSPTTGAGRIAVRPFSVGINIKYSKFESDTLHLYETNVNDAESDILALTAPLTVPEDPAALNSAIILDFNNSIAGYGLRGVIENANGIVGRWTIFIQYQTEDGIISDTSAFFHTSETGNGTSHYINFTVGRDTVRLRQIFGDIKGKTITGIGFRLVGTQTVDDINITLTIPRMGLLLDNAKEFFV